MRRYSPLALVAVLTIAGCAEKPKVEDLVQGSAPELPKALAGIEMGAQASALDEKMPDNGGVRTAEAGGLRYQAQLDANKEKLAAIEVSLPKELTIDDLAKDKWGAPLTGQSMNMDFQSWGNEETGLLVRAWSPYDAQRLKFSHYAPISTMLSKSGEGLGLEKPRPILGSTKEELKAAYPSYEDAGKSHARLRLPKTICADIFTTVTITFGQFGQVGKATAFELKIKDDVCETPPDALNKALGTFGSASPDDKDKSMTLFSTDPMVALKKSKDGWTVAVVGVVKQPG